MSEVFIYDAVRTARASVRAGAGRQVSPIRLAAGALSGLAARSNLPADAPEEVVLGCVVATGEQGGDLTRAAILAAGLDEAVPGAQISRFCSSGLDAVAMVAGQIAARQIGIGIGGGVESMSRVPMGADRASWTADPRETFATHYVPQGVSADLLATIRGYGRADVDAYAVESQRRAAAAQQARAFDRSLLPILDGNGEPILLRDDLPRPETSLESLGRLEAAFSGPGREAGYDERALLRYPEVERVEHVHTAGNSSGVVDGAAAVLLGGREAGARLGLTPRARIRSWAAVGSEPTIMLTGPTPASRRALSRAGMEVGDIDLFEINEAFAAVAMATMEDLGVGADRVNVNGGAIALGHPLGASGAMLLGTVLDELERRGLGTGLVTLCVAGGMGSALVIERV